ncbi:unnamed protein product, partial [marine sediment metagenome]
GYSLPERMIDIHNHVRAADDVPRFIELMDECKVEVTLVMGGPGDYESRNKAVVKACHEHPDRLVGGPL